MGRNGHTGDGWTIGKIQLCAAVSQQLQRIRAGTAVPPVAGGAAHHSGRPDGLRQRRVGAVLLAVVSDFEEVGPQIAGGDPVIASQVGVPRQQEPRSEERR